jgi:hypothetical protein
MMDVKFALFGVNRQVYWSANSEEDMTEFLIDIIFCFGAIVNNETRQIQISCLQTSSVQLRQNVDALITKYEELDPKIHRIRTFVTSMPDGENFYFLPNIEQPSQQEHMALVVQLMAENNNLDPIESLEEMRKGIGTFLDTYLIDGKITDKKISIGEPLKANRVCRFCKNTRAETESKHLEQRVITTFRQQAHAISEALGNKTLILNEECDACNAYFSRTCEKHILTYFKVLATFFKVKNKDNNVSTIKGKNFEFMYLSDDKKPALLNSGPDEKPSIQSSLDNQGNIIAPPYGTLNPSDVDFVIKYVLTDEERGETDAFPKSIPLKFFDKISIQEIYKALVKFSLSVIDSKNLSGFENTLQWVAGLKIETQLPKIAILRSYQHFSDSPELKVFIRKNGDKQLPFAVGEFQFTFQKFVFIIPTFKDEERSFLTEEEYNHFWSFFIFKQASGWEFQDFSDPTEKNFVFNMRFSQRSEETNLNE